MNGHCHLVGVAGAGMSALAQALIGQGRMVSGSDRDHDRGMDLAVLHKLRCAGVRLTAQDGSGIGADTSRVIRSTAVEDDNEDLLAAGRAGVPVVHRAAMLARLVEDTQCVVVSGTSGKSTVTGMIGWILEALGKDPTVVNGAAVTDWANEGRIGNVRLGKSPLWVIEGDESDRSLLQFHPDHAVVTNIGTDHFSATETRELFDEFCGQVKSPVVGAPGATADEARVALQTGFGSEFLYGDVLFRISLPGAHNVENAVHALALCEQLGLELQSMKKPLASFRGIERRLQVVGEAAGVTVIDDYAHNPAKIRAAWNAVAPYFNRVLAVWRPHGFGPLAFMHTELVSALADLCATGDRVFVLPVYYAGGTAERAVTSRGFVEELQARGVPAVLADDYETCVKGVAGSAGDGDVVLSMGARDPELPQLAARILECVGEK